MLGLIITLAIVGMFAGFIARALVPGRDHMSIPATILLGVVGSFVGGFIGWLMHGHRTHGSAFHTSGFLGSIVGAVIALLVYNAVSGRKAIR